MRWVKLEKTWIPSIIIGITLYSINSYFEAYFFLAIIDIYSIVTNDYSTWQMIIQYCRNMASCKANSSQSSMWRSSKGPILCLMYGKLYKLSTQQKFKPYLHIVNNFFSKFCPTKKLQQMKLAFIFNNSIVIEALK